MNKKKLIIFFTLINLFNVFATPTSTIKNSDRINMDYSDQKENIYVERFEYDENYTVDYIYYKSYDELVMNISCNDKVFTTLDLEFCIYTAENLFIRNKNHRYYKFSEIGRQTIYNKDQSDIVLTTVRVRLYK